MKKKLTKGMLALVILMVALFGVGGSALAGLPPHHSIERSIIVEPTGLPPHHSIERSIIVEPTGLPPHHSPESAPVIVETAGLPPHH